MSSEKVDETKKTVKGELEIRGLENFLQRCLKNEDLKLLESKITNLVPVGENYLSTIVKLDVKVQIAKDRVEKWNFVAKMSDPESIVPFSWPMAFKKELFAYNELLPVYRDIEKEAGVAEEDLINILPKFIGYRNSLKYGDEIDNDSIFVMDNLKVKNYYTLDKITGLDKQHTEKSFEALAKFHAMGIAMKQKRPEFFTKAHKLAQLAFIDEQFLKECLDCVRKTFNESTRLSKYLDKLELSMKYFLETEGEEPWATISHCDFWTNNIMFHKDDEGKIDNVKIIDFQTYEYRSALQDLGCFVGCCLDEKTLNDHLDELIEIYYQSFIDTLKRVGCDLKPFTKESFETELKKNLFVGFSWSVFCLRIFVYDIDEEDEEKDEDKKSIFESETSEACKERLYKLVEFYESKNWFS